YASSVTQTRLASAIAPVKAATWRARLNAVLSVDVAERLHDISVPVLYLRAKYDWVVPRSASGLIARCLPRLKVIEIDGPHFLLQAKPAESAAQVQTFVQEIRC